MIGQRRIDRAIEITERSFYVPSSSEGGGPATKDYSIFCPHMRTFDLWNVKQASRYFSPVAHYMQQTLKHIHDQFDGFIETDLILYIRSSLENPETSRRWSPSLLVYATQRYKPFPLFARSESKKVLYSVLPLLGFSTLGQFSQTIRDLDERRELRFSWDSVSLAKLVNLEHFGARP